MRELEEAFMEGVWGIAATSAGKYIGQFRSIRIDDGAILTGPPTVSKAYLIEHLTNPIQMRWPMEFSVMSIPTQVETPHGVQLVINRQIHASPIGRCHDIENLTISITPVDIIFFDDMSKVDAEWHRNLIRNSLRSILEQRLAASNILSPHSRPTPHV